MSEDLYTKIAIAIGSLVLFGFVGGRLFYTVARHLVLKYFEGLDKKIEAAFLRIDQLREDRQKFIYIEFRDYKRDVAIEIKRIRDNVEDLYEKISYLNNKCKEYDEKSRIQQPEK